MKNETGARIGSKAMSLFGRGEPPVTVPKEQNLRGGLPSKGGGLEEPPSSATSLQALLEDFHSGGYPEATI